MPSLTSYRKFCGKHRRRVPETGCGHCATEQAMAEQRRNVAGQAGAETKRLSALAVDVWGRDGDA